jgi:ribonuclease-3
MDLDLVDTMQRSFSKGWTDVKGFLSRFFSSSGKSAQDSSFSERISLLTGLPVRNIDLYRLATRHSSAASQVKDHNERLEYLGDAVLGAVVAEYLFKKFPFKEEGFLTEIRSRIVNGEHLAGLARKTGLSALIDHDKRQKGGQLQRSSMHGDALEALVAAVFLDHGFEKCKKFIVEKLLSAHVDLDTLLALNANFKSQLIEWAQRQGKKVQFVIVDEKGASHRREFVAEVLLGGELLGRGTGLSKKKAEQAAAEKALSKTKF